jgi:hypothetical protein
MAVYTAMEERGFPYDGLLGSKHVEEINNLKN